MPTNEKNDGEDSDEPVRKDYAQSNPDRDAQHEHGLEEESEIVIDDWDVL